MEEEKNAQTPQPAAEEAGAPKEAGEAVLPDGEIESGPDAGTVETAGDKAEPELEKARSEALKYKDCYIRTLADFDNFRKRTQRDREDIFKRAAEDVIAAVLPSIDNFERALAQAPGDEAIAEFVKGVRLTYEGLLKALSQNGAEPFESKGKPFDPNFHEAMSRMPSKDIPADSVAFEIRKGWLLHGKLLRSAQVVVSTGPEA